MQSLWLIGILSCITIALPRYNTMDERDLTLDGVAQCFRRNHPDGVRQRTEQTNGPSSMGCHRVRVWFRLRRRRKPARFVEVVHPALERGLSGVPAR